MRADDLHLQAAGGKEREGKEAGRVLTFVLMRNCFRDICCLCLGGWVDVTFVCVLGNKLFSVVVVLDGIL